MSITPAAANEPPLEAAKRVLVVDDNQDAAEMLAVLLTAWGLQTRVAYDGLSALTIAQDFEPAVALLDIGLPGLDGYETALRMRQQTWGRTALLVAVTGWGQATDLARSREAGFDHHLVKPVDPKWYMSQEEVASTAGISLALFNSMHRLLRIGIRTAAFTIGIESDVVWIVYATVETWIGWSRQLWPGRTLP